MNKQEALDFCRKYHNRQFYQPVIFVPGSVEIIGKWHNATIEMSKRVLNDIKGKSLLDLGCHNGYFLHEAIRLGASKAVGVDHDPIEIDIAQEINEIFQDRAEIHQDSIEYFVPKEKFDVILMFNVLDVLNDPLDVIVRYLNFTKTCLFIEHEEHHKSFFPCPPTQTVPSPRAVGHRKLSRFQVQQVLNNGYLKKS